MKALIEVVLNEGQAKVLRSLIPFYGSHESEVLKSIFIMWINDNYGVRMKNDDE